MKEYISRFKNELESVHATLDTEIMVKILKVKKITYQDDKSGMGMFKHSSKGSISVLSYDSSGNNVQITSKPITITDIIKHNKNNLNKLKIALTNDGINKNTMMKNLNKSIPISKSNVWTTS